MSLQNCVHGIRLKNGPDPGVQGLGGRVPKVVPLIAGQKGFKTHPLSAPESKRAWRGGLYTLQAPGE